MKPRLIDANKLKRDDLCDICKSADCSNCFTDEDFEQWINNQPKAYDIGKVINQLNNESFAIGCAFTPKETRTKYIKTVDAIEIVKGGKNE